MDTDASAADVRQLIDQEADLIASAMRLVASGVAPRTVVAGLRLTDAALTIAARQAGGLGVRVEAIWRPDETGQDVVVTRLVGAGTRA